MQFKKTGIAVVAALAAALAATPALARPHGGVSGHSFAAGGHGWSGHGGYGRGGGLRGFGAGLAAGAVIGGAYGYGYGYGDPYYGDDYAYYGDDDYYGDAYAAAPEYVGGSGSCAMRYRSYDPATGTFLGYDGIRHPCP